MLSHTSPLPSCGTLPSAWRIAHVFVFQNQSAEPPHIRPLSPRSLGRLALLQAGTPPQEAARIPFSALPAAPWDRPLSFPFSIAPFSSYVNNILTEAFVPRHVWGRGARVMTGQVRRSMHSRPGAATRRAGPTVRPPQGPAGPTLSLTRAVSRALFPDTFLPGFSCRMSFPTPGRSALTFSKKLL